MNLFRFKTALSATTTLLLLFQMAATAEIPFATDAPKPLSPEEAVGSFQLPDDLQISLVASEPLIAEPGAMVFDERGQLFVGELHGYNLEGYYDIQELNQTGVLDREVRRVRVDGPHLEQARREAVGAIKLLIDDDGDGRMDRAEPWAEGLPPCYGLVCARKGLIAICPPKIIYLADEDGDHRAEIRETLFEGFGFDVLERGINSPRRGADNWIYAAGGGGGGEIAGPNLNGTVRIGHSDFRFKEDGSAIEMVAGASGTFGMALTDAGERFITTTSRHAMYATPLEYRHLVRNPNVRSPDGTANGANYDRIFPISDPDPWRAARDSDPNWVAFYGKRETTPHGYFTGACGPIVYRGDGLPDRFAGNYFCCAPANNLIHRSVIEREGAGFRVRRDPAEEESEFLASTDRWFRPINTSFGPDGALYIVDYYREIIEDYSAIPRHLQQRYVESLRAGYEHGRIWKVTAKATPPPSTFAVGSDEKLVASLDHVNPWRRETAQRLLIARRTAGVESALRKLIRDRKSAAGRLHALYTLDGLGRLEPGDVEGALSDTDYGVRVHGLRMAERWINVEESLREKALKLAHDPDPAVRLQAAQSFGECSDERAVDALASMAIEFGDERWMAAAILSSAAKNADKLIEALVQRLDSGGAGLAVMQLLGTSIATGGEEDSLHQLLHTIASLDPETTTEIQQTLLDGMLEGLEQRPAKALGPGPGHAAMARLLANGHISVRERALRAGGLLEVRDSAAMEAAWNEAVDASLNDDRTMEERLAGIYVLSAAPWQKRKLLEALLDPAQPPEVQLAAVRAIGAADDAEVAAALLKPYPHLSPKTQETVLDALFANEDRLPSVLDAIADGRINPSAIPPLRRALLLQSGRSEIRERAATLIDAGPSADRAAVIEQFEPALRLTRDSKRGRAIFEERCAECHVLDGTGYAVGPDLAAVRMRPDETLLADILDPSGAITPGYASYVVTTQDGELYTGTVAEETATSLALRRAKGETDAILRKDIAEMRATTLSLMPDGLEQGITPQDFADLLGYLRETGGPMLAPGIVLFDDELAFVEALVDGGGRAELVTEAPHSGQASLRVTPLQRHARHIEDWRFDIVEQPAAEDAESSNQFRYMRLAWKSEGDGVMLELAADGQWPPAEAAVRRYYSGANSTGWAAKQISHDPPRDWRVVTFDLWKDFGPFTLTGIAPTAMGGPVYFDRIELLRTLDD